jgi:hypothetical protein
MATQPILVEKTQDIEEQDEEQVGMPKSIYVEDILTEAVAMFYERDATKDMNQEKELEDIVEKFLVAI